MFAPVAAALATGVDVDALGPRIDDPMRLSLPDPLQEGRQLRGQVIYVDHFGNLVTNLPGDAFPHADVSISIGDARIRGVAVSYAAAARGSLVAVVNSWDLIEIAVRDGSARDRLGAAVGAAVSVSP